MSSYDFSLWVNGFGFGVMVICALGLLLAPERLRAVRVPCTIAACTYFYLAARIIFCSFVPLDSAIYFGHGAEMRAMFGMSTAFPVAFIFIQLARYRHVNLKFVAKHFALPVVLMLAFITCALSGLEQVLVIIFRLYVLNVLLFMVYHLWRTIQATRRYEEELLNIYVSSEQRSIRWFWWVSAAAICLFSGNMIFSLFWNDLPIGDVYHMFSSFLWIYVAYRIAILRDASIPFEEDLAPAEIAACAEVPDVAEADEDEPAEIDQAALAAVRQQETEQFMIDLRKALEDDDLLFDEDLNRDMVTRKMAITHITLGRRLKDATGMTFSAYVSDLRLERIADLLLSSDDNIDNIYCSCGFSSRTTFYRAFARKYNCSPVEYRRNGKC